MRLFTAVELPDAVRGAVRRAFEETVLPQFPSSWRVRAVEEANLHVTVRFLGDVQPAALPALREALAGAAATVTESRLVRARGFGAFPPRGAPRVLWAGIDDPARTIASIERAVSTRIAPLGFPPEDRPYTPHVTAARISAENRRGRGRRTDAPRAPLVLPADLPLGPAFAVRELSLVLSEPTPPGARFARGRADPLASRGSGGEAADGPRYRTLCRMPLATAPLSDPNPSQE